jgi:hypothetical protein
VEIVAKELGGGDGLAARIGTEDPVMVVMSGEGWGGRWRAESRAAEEAWEEGGICRGWGMELDGERTGVFQVKGTG